MQQSAEAHYISQVLGIEHVFPQSSQPIAIPKTVGPLMLLTPFDLSAPEKEMVEKMLAAAGVLEKEYCTLGNISEQPMNFGLSFGVDASATAKLNHMKWTHLPSISQFLNADDPKKLNALKRAAWAELQSLKKAIDLF